MRPEDTDAHGLRLVYYNRRGEPISLAEFAELHDDFERNMRVARTNTHRHHISTVLLGMDHNWGVGGKPLIFETMIFCRHEPECWMNEWQKRYCTEEEALEGHERAVSLVTHSRKG